jgi:hypothetical protein
VSSGFASLASETAFFASSVFLLYQNQSDIFINLTSFEGIASVLGFSCVPNFTILSLSCKVLKSLPESLIY